LVALLSTLAKRGNTQIAAAQSLQQFGISSFEFNESVEFQILSVPNANGVNQMIGLPVASASKDRFDFARRLCGNSFSSNTLPWYLTCQYQMMSTKFWHTWKNCHIFGTCNIMKTR
jgi:hypothetical protein